MGEFFSALFNNLKILRIRDFIDVAIVAIIVFLSSYFVVGAYVQTFIAALSVALGVVAFTSWIITRGIIALFKGFVNQETFYNLVKEEEAE